MKTATKILKNIKEGALSVSDLENIADSVDQDWENETTIYRFADTSTIQDTNGELTVK